MSDPQPSPKDSYYIHGSSQEEQLRLSEMNTWVNPPTLAALQLHPGESLLDVGAGLGQFTRLMAHRVQPGGRVLAIERDSRQLARARRLAEEQGEGQLVEFRHGEALDLPLQATEWESFDVVHTRFLLEHLADPQSAVHAMTRAVRPGGRIVLIDDDHEVLQFSPHPQAFLPLWQAYIRSYVLVGNNPFVGRELVSLLTRAGIRPARVAVIPYTFCSGTAGFEAAVSNLRRLFLEVRPIVLEHQVMEASTFESCLGHFQDWSRLPDAVIWYTFNLAEGRKAD